ncbi:hypothetical protein KCP69_03795 [Salmonella enterica subsp. enterica]|nr:hypothetical protein KCP69_03795 [Salmonella enterica subsp. enterica]
MRARYLREDRCCAFLDDSSKNEADADCCFTLQSRTNWPVVTVPRLVIGHPHPATVRAQQRVYRLPAISPVFSSASLLNEPAAEDSTSQPFGNAAGRSGRTAQSLREDASRKPAQPVYATRFFSRPSASITQSSVVRLVSAPARAC